MPQGEFRRYDTPAALPPDLAPIASYPSADHYRTAVIMRSHTSEVPPSIGGITPAPGSPVFRVAVVRWDRHGNGPEHFNQDESLMFRDQAGRAWRLGLRDQPDHFVALSKDSGLPAALELTKLPPAPSGPVKQLLDLGRNARFSTQA